MSNNIAENICESIKIVGESLLQGLSYDQTIECTIINTDKKDQGMYRVSNGATSFLAYSNESYSKNDAVYVTIPGGDYNNQKLIVGRKVKGENDYFKYHSPFEQYVDVTGNMAAAAGSPVGLTANKDAVYKEKVYENGAIIEKTFSDGQLIEVIPLTALPEGFGTGFTRLGLKASFQSLLSEYNCVAGDYGLWIRLTFENDDIKLSDSDNAAEEIIKTQQKDLYLDINDMVGNPYQFEGFYLQEKVFNISTLGKVINIQGWFYQDKNFYNNKNELIPSRNEDLDSWFAPNLFIQDWYISLGYDLLEVQDELVQIYTEDALAYRPIDSTEQTQNQFINQKEIELRWLHYDTTNNEIHEIKEGTAEPISIRWYRYRLGAPSPDEHCGTNWELASNTIQNVGLYVNSGVSFTAILMPDTSLVAEQIRAVVIYGEAIYEEYETVNEQDYMVNRRHYYIYDDKLNEHRQCTNNDDFDTNTTYFMLVEDTRQVYYSNILTFTNQEYIPDQTTLNAIEALGLACYDIRDAKYIATQGNYLLYDEAHALRDAGEAKVSRQVRAVLALPDGEKNLKNADSITWRFPTTNTMIKIDADFASSIDFKATEDDIQSISVDLKDAKYFHSIVNNIEEEWLYPIFNYNIAKQFNYTSVNNWIECSVVYKGITYTTIKELTFGIAGTMGSEYTFVLDYDKNINAITIGDMTPIVVNAYLYDANQELIPWSSLSSVPEYKWYSAGKDNISIEAAAAGACQLQPLDGLNINEIFILQATLSGVGDVDLITYLPIALRTDTKYKYVSGPTFVVYSSSGEPYYTRTPFVMHAQDQALYTDWSLLTSMDDDGNEEKSYLPSIQSFKRDGVIEHYYLQPSIMYFDTTRKVAAQFIDGGVAVWTQPIMITQNIYASGLLNSWDGKGVDIDDEGGSILANLIGAGKKNTNDNTFSGVLMGEWKPTTGSYNTGLYGFDHGAMAYAFKDNGTAFIGKSGSGRINFDGNKGTIASSSYEAAKQTGIQDRTSGMLIDLDDGLIDMYGDHAQYSTVLIEDVDAFEKNSPLYILDGFEYKLISEYDENIRMYYKKYVEYSVIYTQYDVDNAEEYETVKNALYYLNSDGQYAAVGNSAFDAATEYFVKREWTEGDVRPHIKIQTLSNPYFQIQVPYTYSENADIKQELKNLLYIGDNQYYLQSANYIYSNNDDTPGKGMKISLPEGSIDAYNFKLTSYNITMKSGENETTYFRVQSRPIKVDEQNKPILDENNKVQAPSSTDRSARVPLIYMSDYNYHLQSANYDSDSQGMKIDLSNGRIDAYNFKLSSKNITIDSTKNANVYFEVKNDAKEYADEKTGETIIVNAKPLIKVSNSEFILESANYEVNKTGTKINLITGHIDAYNFKLSSKNVTIESTKNASTYFEVRNDDKEYTDEETGEIITRVAQPLIHVSQSSLYLQSANYFVGKTDGMKINLTTGRIDAYNFNLSTDRLYINSTNPTFYIGNTPNYQANTTTDCIYFNVSTNAESGTVSELILKATHFTLAASKQEMQGDNTVTNNIKFTSNTGEDPLTIGSNFSVSWDGKITAKDAELIGTIEADSGRIGYWNIQTGTYGTDNKNSYSRLWTAGGGYITSLYSEYPSTAADYRFIIVPGTTASDNGLIEGAPTFYIRKNGYLYADTGKIAGFEFKYLNNDKTGYQFGVDPPDDKDTGNITYSYMRNTTLGSTAGYFQNLYTKNIWFSVTYKTGEANYKTALRSIKFTGVDYNLYRVLSDYHTLEDIYAKLA